MTHNEETIVRRDFPCPECGTVFLTNRSEPHCIADHPTQWHLQRIVWGPVPCDTCETWREAYEASEARYNDPENTSDMVLMYPPPGVVIEPGYCPFCLLPTEGSNEIVITTEDATMHFTCAMVRANAENN